VDWTFWIVKLANAGFILAFTLGIAGLLGWVERKQSAVMQDRIGANRAPIFGLKLIGLFHPIADAVKSLTKEDWVPPFADRKLHFLAPVLSLFTILAAWSVVPFGDMIRIGGKTYNLQIADLHVGFLFIFAMASLGVYGVVVAGVASNNKYGLLGAMRGMAQMIAYEVSFGLTLLGICLLFGSLQLDDIVRAQGTLIGGWLPRWGILLQPIGFILFLVTAVAETRRLPFDTPEGESEIIGYFVEYSGMKFVVFWMSEFIAVTLAAALIATFFFGGWQVPFLMADGFHFPGGATIALPHALVVLLQVAAFSLKTLFFIWFLMLVRWTLPRFRFDQVMALGWKNVLPLAMLNLALTAVLAYLIRPGA